MVIGPRRVGEAYVRCRGCICSVCNVCREISTSSTRLTCRHTSGEGHGSLSTQATFSSVEPISAHDFAALLRAAWIDVRFSLHPLLATVSSAPSNELDTEGYSMMYPLVDAEGARRWAEETVTEHEPTTMSALVVSLKDASPTARLSQAGLHWAPSSTDGTFHVVFVGGHWLTDGRGAFKILNQLIRNIDIPPSGEYRWGEEVVRLSLPLAIATGRRTAKSGAVVPLPRSQVDGFLAALVKIDTAFRPCFAHPPSSRNVPRWSPDVIEELCLTESESSVIRHTCRARGITITALFNVILAMVFVEDPAALDEINTVQIPFFATHREDDMLEEHKGSVGLQLTISPFALDARSVQACLDPARSRASLIWSLAVKAKRQLAGATVRPRLHSLVADTPSSHTTWSSHTNTRSSAICYPPFSTVRASSCTEPQFHSPPLLVS